MRRKSLIRPVKTTERTDARNVKHIYSALGGIKKIPSAAYEGCVLVPFHLATCIPEGAIRKFAANKSFIIHVNDCGEESLCFSGKQDKLPFDLKSYQIQMSRN
jgi:hypothetical protein